MGSNPLSPADTGAELWPVVQSSSLHAGDGCSSLGGATSVSFVRNHQCFSGKCGAAFCLEKHFLCRALGFSLCSKSANRSVVYQCCPCKTGLVASAGGDKWLWPEVSASLLWEFTGKCSDHSFWKYFASAAEGNPRHISHQNGLPRLLFLLVLVEAECRMCSALGRGHTGTDSPGDTQAQPCVQTRGRTGTNSPGDTQAQPSCPPSPLSVPQGAPRAGGWSQPRSGGHAGSCSSDSARRGRAGTDGNRRCNPGCRNRP